MDTQPKLVILDTRTRRWHSERDSGQPSGLMDWEALSELQQQLFRPRSLATSSHDPARSIRLFARI